MNDQYFIYHDPKSLKISKVFHKPIRFSDNEDYYVMLGSVVITVRNTSHGDWKTAIAQSIPQIPVGTELIVEEVFQNFYGIWITVNYNGRSYDIDPRDLQYVRKEK